MADLGWNSRTSYTGNGSTTDRLIGFPYLSSSDVYVYLNGVLQTSGYSFLNPTTIRFTVATASGILITFRRFTDKMVLTTLPYGTTPSTTSLNNILTRVQYITQEAADSALSGTLSTISGATWDAQNLKIVNLANGTNSGDAINKSQLDLKQDVTTTLTSILGGITSFGLALISAANAAGGRTALGLGGLAVLSSINDSNWSGTALSVGNGGTGSTTASGARTNLGLGSLAILNSINNGNWSGTALSIANGGTGQTTANASFNALSPMTTAGDIIYGGTAGAGTRLDANSTATKMYLQSVSSGTPSWVQIATADLSGTIALASQVSGTLPITNGGTGQTTANAALNALLPTQTGNSGKVLQTDGTNTSWQSTAGAGTVTSVATSGLATGGTITSSGTINVPAAATSDVLTSTDTAKALTSSSVAPLWVQGADLASATTLTVGQDGAYFNVTGTTTITGLTQSANLTKGREVTLKFAGALTLTHNATSLILPGATNITTAAGDVATFRCEDATNKYWRCTRYQTASGLSLFQQLSKSFSPSDQTITSAGQLTLAHGLGAVPKSVQFLLVCQTAEFNYSIGDVIEAFTSQINAAAAIPRGLSVKYDTTNITLRFGSNSAAFQDLDATTGAAQALTNANWKLRVRAYA